MGFHNRASLCQVPLSLTLRACSCLSLFAGSEYSDLQLSPASFNAFLLAKTNWGKENFLCDTKRCPNETRPSNRISYKGYISSKFRSFHSLLTLGY